MAGYSNDSKENIEFPFECRKKPVGEHVKQENWQAIESAILKQGKHDVLTGGSPGRRVVRVRVFVMAAASVLLFAFGVWYMSSGTVKPEITELRTDFGEIKNILLPDSSVVVLNANSAIRIAPQWKENEGREVWLEGEAYFQVKKKPATQQKFVVHTKQVDVEVLGTKFNVNTRRAHFVVSLEEGKVRLSVHGESQSVMEKKSPVVMRPGQVAVIDASKQAEINEERDVATHSGWSRNEFHFDNTPLADVARMIEDVYGYKMEARDTSLLHRSLSGDLRASNVQELVKVLEFTLKLSMRIGDKTIYVTNL